MPMGETRYFSASHQHNKNAIMNEDQEEWYDSLKANDRSSLGISGGSNTRKSFKEVPVHPSILQYIESIGVGIPQRRDHRHRQRSRQGRNHTKRGRGRDDVLDAASEKEFLKSQSFGRGRRSSPKPYQKRSGPDARSGNSTHDQHESSSSWLPPLPFAAPTKANETTIDGHKVKRLPVKILGSAGSIDDEFPRSTKGLTEVALAGRSNVGKSTLLNALLYGNRPDESGEPIKRRLGRRLNPEVTKMPRGKKAIVSSKPGETRMISLYQLTAEIAQSTDIGNDDKDHSDGDAKKKKYTKHKTSLVLSDLPGYGFSYVSEEKSLEWKELMQHYLLHRGRSLKRVLLLLDARHGMKSADFEFLDMLQAALDENARMAKERGLERVRNTLPPIQIVLTKCDLVKQQDLARRVVVVRQQLSESLRREPSSLPVMLVSAKPGVGFNNVRHNTAKGGVLELQRELAALVPNPIVNTISTKW